MCSKFGKKLLILVLFFSFNGKIFSELTEFQKLTHFCSRLYIFFRKLLLSKLSGTPGYWQPGPGRVRVMPNLLNSDPGRVPTCRVPGYFITRCNTNTYSKCEHYLAWILPRLLQFICRPRRCFLKRQ